MCVYEGEEGLRERGGRRKEREREKGGRERMGEIESWEGEREVHVIVYLWVC